jgi:phospholipid/cholesterol/gamma-HCH transport system substrate-binding protein
MERSTLDLWVGLFVVAGFAALAVLALKVGNLGSVGGTETYQLTAPFSNIGGLKPRAAFMAKVTMKIEKRYKFPKDSSASILTAGLLGEQYVGIEGGAEEAMLAGGDTIKLTQSAVVLEKLISQFMYSKAAEGGTK